MHFPNAPSTPENRSRRPAQEFSPAWSEPSDASPLRSSVASSTPSAPRISSVALPGTPNTTPPRSGHLPTPPTSPETSMTGLGLIQLSPALVYNPNRPRGLWNIVSSQAPSGSPVPHYLQQSAFDFGVSQRSLVVRVRIFGATTKWTLEVRASSSRGVTVYDVLNQLGFMLHTPVGNSEYAVHGPQATQSASQCFQGRARVDPTAMQTGLKRLDFLGGRVTVAGLAPARDNSSWDVYFL